jgi:putative phosphoesterase
MEVIDNKMDPFIIGVVSDTHIPDRVHELHPSLLGELRDRNVELILHAGDISVHPVLTQLEQVAPVRAVAGNRDFLLATGLQKSLTIRVHETVISLTHGHLDSGTYWFDKFVYIARGYRFARYQQRLVRVFPDSQVIVFGHTHHAENRWVDGRLFFNPGSVSNGDYLDPGTKFGILKVYRNGKIDSEILPLTGARIRAKRWVRANQDREELLNS